MPTPIPIPMLAPVLRPELLDEVSGEPVLAGAVFCGSDGDACVASVYSI